MYRWHKFKLKTVTMKIGGRDSGVAEESSLLEYDTLLTDK
jgi:hypothetical protein